MNNLKSFLIIIFISLVVWSLCACGSPETQSTKMPLGTNSTSIAENKPPTTAISPVTNETKLTADERAAILDAAWKIVNDKYFDPTFGGVDWQAIGEEYRQKLAMVEDDREFWLEVLNPMLFELGVSHIGALPAESASRLDSITFATGSLGVDVRLLNDMPVVTQILTASPANEAGLLPGFIIVSIDGRTMEEILAEGLNMPPYNDRSRRGAAVAGMRSLMYGEIGQKVAIEYFDANDELKHAELNYAPRNNALCGLIDPDLPQACVEIETRRLEDGIGYIRFSGFLQPVLEGVLQAIDEFQDAPALIIDLRGNPGGVFNVRKAIASKLVGETKLFMRYQLRDRLTEAYLDPVSDPYFGIVVLLVDELSASSAEEFSGSLQFQGRAMVIGAQTPGRCLVMEIEIMPKGALLMYPYGQSQTPNGRVLEDNGVIPDIEVVLNRQQLLRSFDAQLQAAIDYIVEILR